MTSVTQLATAELESDPGLLAAELLVVVQSP